MTRYNLLASFVLASLIGTSMQLSAQGLPLPPSAKNLFKVQRDSPLRRTLPRSPRLFRPSATPEQPARPCARIAAVQADPKVDTNIRRAAPDKPKPLIGAVQAPPTCRNQ